MNSSTQLNEIAGDKPYYGAPDDRAVSVPDQPDAGRAALTVTIDYKDTPDETLIRNYNDGEDEDAFNELVHRYGWKIHRLAFRITHDMRLADEVLQDVFVILAEKSAGFREDSKFSTWLYKVAVNTSFAYLRKNARLPGEVSIESYVTYDENGYLHGVEIEDWSTIPDDIVIRREEMRRIEKAISEMPEIYRTVFHLSALDGHTNPEIGEILGLTLPAVKSRLIRAKRILRQKLTQSEEVSNLA